MKKVIVVLKIEYILGFRKKRNFNSCFKDENGERGLFYILLFLEVIFFRYCVLEFLGIFLLLEYLYILWKFYLKMLCILFKELVGMLEIVLVLFMFLK